MATTLAELLAVRDRAAAFSGWSFDHAGVTHPEGREPWDYAAVAASHVRHAGAVLDLGTGGGERFGEVLASAGFSGRAYATEQWHVNAPVARERLRPLAVPVVRADSLRLPFRGGSFELVLSRHEAVEPAEVDRVLRSGGHFLTQQVFESWQELRPFFPRQTVHPAHEDGYRDWFAGAGYGVRQERHRYGAVFESVGDLVFNLLVAPWEIPGLDVERDFEALRAVERALGSAGRIRLSEARYLLRARKPG